MPGIRGQNFHPRKLVRSGELGRHGGMRSISIEADYPPPGGHPLGQQVENPARPAAQIDRAVPGPQRHSV